MVPNDEPIPKTNSYAKLSLNKYKFLIIEPFSNSRVYKFKKCVNLPWQVIVRLLIALVIATCNNALSIVSYSRNSTGSFELYFTKGIERSSHPTINTY